LSDLSALRYNYRYEYKKLNYHEPALLSSDFCLRVCVSFKSLLHVPHERFERVEEWVSSDRRCHITGIIHYSRLLESDWWKQEGVSLIMYPDGITEGYVARERHVEQYAEV